MFRQNLVYGLVLGLTGVATAHGSTTYSFESATGPAGDIVSDGWFDAAGNSAFLSLSTTTGVTDGSSSLQIDVATSGFTNLIRRFDTVDGTAGGTPLNLFAGGGTLTADIYFEAGTGAGATPEVFLARQGLGDNYTLGSNFTSEPNNFSYFRAVADAASTSVSFELPVMADDPGFNPAGNTYELILGAQNYGANATFYVDNVVFTPIPEPGSLALLGLGSLVMLRRRQSA